MQVEQWAEIVQRLREATRPEEQAFHPMGDFGGERHGSWVWVCVNTDPAMDRYVELGVTHQPAMLEGDFEYSVAISAEGESEDRLQRLNVGYLQYPDPEFLMRDIESGIGLLFTEGIRKAAAIRVEDLTVSRPRFQSVRP